MEKEKDRVPEDDETSEEIIKEDNEKSGQHEEVFNQEDTKQKINNEKEEIKEDIEKNNLKEQDINEDENKNQDHAVQDISMNKEKIKKLEEIEIKSNEKNEGKNVKEAVEDKEFKQTENKPSKSKNTVVISVMTMIAIFAIMIISIIFALLNINNKKILKGISILDIDVSDLTVEEAKNRVNDAIEAKFTNEKDSIVLKRGEIETSVNANTFNAKFDVDTAVAEAYNIGRSGNIVTNNYAILATKLFKKNIESTLYYDTDFMKSTINDINSKMKDSVIEYSYYIEDNNLIVVKGKAGYVIKVEELTEKIIKQLKNIHAPYQEVEIPVEYKEPDDVDLEKIRNEIYKEPKDAYIEKNPTVVHVEENGVDFAISMEEAQKLLEEDKEEYEIPLKITAPNKKLSDLGEEAFPDQLATFSTIYDASATNRAYNVELATKKINGTVIMPGETFSYNKTVGSRTIEAGWKEGTAYISGKVVPSVGGGVCQVSSTLYNAALLANLEITERTNHTFTVDYVAASRDATVYYGSLDFCFKNTRTYPIKIVASAKNGVCKISLYGIKEKVEYEVIIQSKVTSYINYTTTYKEDKTLDEGKEIVEQAGFNGCRSEGYRILKLNGKVVSQTLLSKDTYSAQERIVRKGTKK